MPKIRVRHGENEIELDGDLDFIAQNLKSFYERHGAGNVRRAGGRGRNPDQPVAHWPDRARRA